MTDCSVLCVCGFEVFSVSRFRCECEANMKSLGGSHRNVLSKDTFMGYEGNLFD